MGTFARTYAAAVVAWLAVFQGHLVSVACHDSNYKDALTKSIIFLEAQRSGKLPPNHRPSWRGDSALDDGKEANVDLVGGYYDAGDNVKYGLPMAFTTTTLAWSAIAYKSHLQAAGELENVRAAIRWGTDYFLKAAARRDRLYVQVGDPVKDHECWVRPEKMKTPRTVLQINASAPGTEIAAETAAAMAASSMVFRGTDRAYARRLLNKAKLLFEFAKSHKGTYDGECPFYCSYSGYNDELLWAAAWLYHATFKSAYLHYIKEEAVSAVVDEFNWDLKYAGVQVLLSQFFFKGDQCLKSYKDQADSYICSVLPESPYFKIPMTPGGMIHLRDGANTQYVTGAAFLFTIYGDMLQKFNQKVQCGDKQFDSTHLLAFAKQQMDYILGKNPEGRSYMVGFGNNPPKQAHHRGASVPVSEANLEVGCPMSFVRWYNKDVPNPNELTGAILGGPDKQDHFTDLRWTSVYTEPCTYVNSQAVAPLAKLTCPSIKP
ncbi:Glycoside hydrolase family 9 - like 10 [Theobroma cacao]|uniref:Endoglucanase n=1 Tax=Theobroma cacao TaxID=3641 RepID=A0A061GKW7_THECC|nr:Glycosyl hydrolase 9A4 isoform 1 [Theobroma cacao]EOY30059.1 Glycosyl hydrolase 9A4 isoform 1 [Theobroma cacao]WRX32941.1 Glycoside hydrolase family 9 - like 10 [Theobroma cacao]